MGIFFEPFTENKCCLCGSSDRLTGEHKIKASAIKAEFGDEILKIGRFDDVDHPFKFAQSPKSKAFHFKGKLCADCNNAKTQAPDREFEHFNENAREFIDKNLQIDSIFKNHNYVIGSGSYLNLFRYFAKLLCCHMAEIQAPRHIHLSSFATGKVHKNCVWLSVDRDWEYERMSQCYGDHPYAAHGGLVVYGRKDTGEATGFHSTLTLGPLRYVFYTRLNWFERSALKISHPAFNDWCREKVMNAIDNPITETDLRRLGLK